MHADRDKYLLVYDGRCRRLSVWVARWR